VLLLLPRVGGNEADAVDDVVAGDLEGLAVLAANGNAAVVDVGDGGLRYTGTL
jgi:hypothetical protein